MEKTYQRYVYANSTVYLPIPGGVVSLNRGEVWYADDPFVIKRPDLFDAAPPIVHSTVTRAAPESAPLASPNRTRR